MITLDVSAPTVTTPADVAVIGGGPAGSATARWLANAGCRVVLVERSRFDRPRAGESLQPATNSLLRALGVWSRFEAIDPLPSYGTSSIWGAAPAQRSSHLFTPYGCGWHVDRAAFDRMLMDAAVASGAIVHRVACTGVERIGSTWSVSLLGTSPVSARVVVDATGRAARIGRRLGGRRLRFDNLVGIAAGLSRSADGYVLVESVADGWWCSAPDSTGRTVATLMTDTDLCRLREASAPHVWRALLDDAPATARRVDGSLMWGPRAFPAGSQRLRRDKIDDDGPQWLAVGDAALAVDPISGSGVARALRTAHAAASAILASMVGRRDALETYEQDRDRECTAFLLERAEYYSAEQRWASSPFWSRRHAIDRGERPGAAVPAAS